MKKIMPWTKTANSAQFKGADWNNFVMKRSDCTPEQARRIAFMNPQITFYFFCREYMVLEGPVYDKYGAFEPGDAVFFTGEPWLGSAPQADTYQKNGIALAYINPASPDQFKGLGCFTLADGDAAVDAVSIFGGNYCTNEIPCLRAQNNDPPTTKPFNDNIQAILDDGSVKYLQDKGIVVLLTILNGHSQVGWSEFTDQTTAQNFVNYLQQYVITPYGLDGIDIDDEWSDGTANDTSLIMVSTLFKQTMPGTLLTKALWNDQEYFQTNWQGNTLAGALDYGWEMSYYGGDGNDRLTFYAENGMSKTSLVLGFSAENTFSGDWGQVATTMPEVVSDGWGGGMIFDYENTATYQGGPVGVTLLGQIVTAEMGPGNWNQTPNCP